MSEFLSNLHFAVAYYRFVKVHVVADIEEEEEDDEDDDEDDESMYDFESKMEKAKYSMNHKRVPIKRNILGFQTYPSQQYEVAMGRMHIFGLLDT